SSRVLVVIGPDYRPPCNPPVDPASHGSTDGPDTPAWAADADLIPDRQSPTAVPKPRPRLLRAGVPPTMGRSTTLRFDRRRADGAPMWRPLMRRGMLKPLVVLISIAAGATGARPAPAGTP